MTSPSSPPADNKRTPLCVALPAIQLHRLAYRVTIGLSLLTFLRRVGGLADSARVPERESHGRVVRMAMDDFGTGYSSLGQVRGFPIDILKIDRAFITNIGRAPADIALATAIVNLAASLDKRTLAEGVETPAQLAHLQTLGVALAQGYLFARPLHAGHVDEILQLRTFRESLETPLSTVSALHSTASL